MAMSNRAARHRRLPPSPLPQPSHSIVPNYKNFAILNETLANLFAEERSFVTRSTATTIVAATGFLINYCVYDFTGIYFSSLTIIPVILIALFGGLGLGLLYAVILSLAADYYFIQPIGTVFDSVAGYEHFFIITGLAIFVALVGSTLRTAFRRTMLAKQEAERVSILMERLLAIVSHDIRNPLSGIQMGCEFILRHPEPTAKRKSTLAMMLRSVKRADSMIGSLLDVARIRAGNSISLDLRTCDLGAELGLALEEMSLMGCRHIDLAASVSIWGEWAISEIRRALENLVINASKYGEPNMPITVKLERRKGDAILSVHNYGQAISLEDQEKLFQAFQRVGRAENGAVKGWGLGLALVKGIAEAHGGNIAVQSDVVTGTTFTLRLPIRAEAPQQCVNVRVGCSGAA
jgi:signal transduction histidine kinase